MTELVFKGKEFVWNHHLAVPFRPLVMQPEKGIGEARLDGNLIVQGDNLHALKALLPMYAGRVDCIFIDPPYNTGNEGWAYNDNVNAPMIKEWLDANPIGIEDGLRHDKWCAMMWPRLRLLWELLSDRGAIFVICDDNESARLKLLLDEICGEHSYVSTIVWQKVFAKKNKATISGSHDSIHIFSKRGQDWERNLIARSDQQEGSFSNRGNDPRGPWQSVSFSVQSEDSDRRKDYRYKVDLPNGDTIGPPAGRHWNGNKARFKSLRDDNRLWFGEKGDKRPRVKVFLSEVQQGIVPDTWWSHLEYGNNQEAKKELNQIFGEGDVFATPKPMQLLTKIIEIATKPDFVVLDSFSGSGTTAHAVLEANRRDGGNRRFILVEMEDYADRLTAERVRRVIEGYDFTGTQRTELLRESLTWTKLQRTDRLTEQVEKIENLHGHEYDRIKKEVKDGELIVTGEKRVEDRAEGLGGAFTYCTLGAPVELDHILTGEDLPTFDALAGVLFHMATSQPLDPAQMDESRAYVGEAGGTHVWLIYRPDLDWLKSPQAALTLTFARSVAEARPDARHLVFAPARYVSQRLLDAEGLPVEFAPLPFSLYRVERT